MPRPLLPPHYINVPAHLVYKSPLPPAVMFTFVQLCGLAWGTNLTPPLTMQELAGLTGRSQASLYRHMSQLRDIDALSWRTTGSGSLIVSISPEPTRAVSAPQLPPPILNFEPDPANLASLSPPDSQSGESIRSSDSHIQESSPEISALARSSAPDSQNCTLDSQNCESDSQNQESPINYFTPPEDRILESDHDSLLPLVNPEPLNLDPPLYNQDLKDLNSSLLVKINPPDMDGENQILDCDLTGVNSTGSVNDLGGERECEGERGEDKKTCLAGIFSSDAGLARPLTGSASTPESVYAELTGLTPSPEQVTRMDLRVKNLAIWRDTLQHWLSHRWNPHNLGLLFAIYDRGGSKGCLFCSNGNLPRRSSIQSAPHPPASSPRQHPQPPNPPPPTLASSPPTSDP